MAVYNRWTGLVDWTSGLDYWTDRLSSEHAGPMLHNVPKSPAPLLNSLTLTLALLDLDSVSISLLM